MKNSFALKAAFVTALALSASHALAVGDGDPKYPSSDGNDIGDHLALHTDVYGFVPVTDAADVDKQPRCAGSESSLSITSKTNDFTFVEFHGVQAPKSTDTCGSAKSVQKGTTYKIANSTYNSVAIKATGLSYGALVVPFKFRLGDDKKLVNSATIAPYIGVRWSVLQGFGYELRPVFAAGIALVSVPNEAKTANQNIGAFSASLGFTLSTIKDSKFSAGVLFGKDFVSKDDRKGDPSVVKPWVSLWLGVSI
ncbi:hypothetical protein GTP46_04635 [Duganella sp. FT135W]|uniref:Outer membrane beta-barrel protein n=1 Tax=Duganella flavida TaxID=2692175 RepID=A0A6L8K5X7_9BURK|nr:hypothetical protein [Duganella flavida]MYM21937.1 hypothetical protein [Duganella flavida]